MMGIILVIEDDRGMVFVLQAMFEREGHKLRCAFNGKQGMEMFVDSPPNAVILDLMPLGTSASDVCRSMKQALYHVPVIIVSAVSDVTEIVLLLQLRADDHVTLPFSPLELRARVQTAIRRSKRAYPNPKDNTERPTAPTRDGCRKPEGV